MNFYTMVTPSHRDFLQRLLMNIPDSLTPVIHEHKQECPSATFRTEGWDAATKHKLQIFLGAAHKEDVFVGGDVDLQFFGDPVPSLLEQLGDADMAFQLDGPNELLCTGFFICRGNEKTQNIFSKCLKRYDGTAFPLRNDQDVFNEIKNLVNYKVLDKRFWSVWRAFKTPTNDFNKWEGQEFDVPQDILMHHANWCLYDMKMQLLDFVRDRIVPTG